ncbi:hypothetical protein AJ88_33695 [Mesorhizobium amorphae CCBAU 01583]|nr:hypothetical protein AJ88_33695 [Mesorhizobium amorphae CCBAU 01583]
MEREIGSIAPGRLADLLIVSDLAAMTIDEVYGRGVRLAKGGKLDIDIPAYDYPKTAKNTVKLGKKLKARDFDVVAPKGANEVRVRVIGVIENQAPTRALEADLPVEDGLVAMDRRNDVCQIALVERHRGTGGVTNAFSPASAIWATAPWPPVSRMTATTSSSSAPTSKTWRSP